MKIRIEETLEEYQKISVIEFNEKIGMFVNNTGKVVELYHKQHLLYRFNFGLDVDYEFMMSLPNGEKHVVSYFHEIDSSPMEFVNIMIEFLKNANYIVEEI